MATCEHASMLETTFAWTIVEADEFWISDGQIKKTEAFTPKFRPNTRVYVSLKSDEEFYDCFAYPCVDGEWDDDLDCYFWSENDKKPGIPIVLGKQKGMHFNLKPPFRVYCKDVSKKCHLCKIFPSVKEQTEQFKNELTVKNSEIAEVSKKRNELTAKMAEFKAENTHYLDIFWKMRTEGKLTDFCLEVEGNSIQVHKLVLAAQSEFFAEKFNADPTETTYKIEEPKSEVVNAMVEFMYLGRVEKFDDYVGSLFKLASKFGIFALKNKCVEFLQTLMSTETHPNRPFPDVRTNTLSGADT